MYLPANALKADRTEGYPVDSPPLDNSPARAQRMLG